MISPGQEPRLWQEANKEEIITISWDEIGDLKNYKSKSEIIDKLKEELDEDRTYMNDSLALWQFENEMRVGDVIYVKKGRNTIFGRGVIESKAYFEPTRGGLCVSLFHSSALFMMESLI